MIQPTLTRRAAATVTLAAFLLSSAATSAANAAPKRRPDPFGATGDSVAAVDRSTINEEAASNFDAAPASSVDRISLEAPFTLGAPITDLALPENSDAIAGVPLLTSEMEQALSRAELGVGQNGPPQEAQSAFGAQAWAVEEYQRALGRSMRRLGQWGEDAVQDLIDRNASKYSSLEAMVDAGVLSDRAISRARIDDVRAYEARIGRFRPQTPGFNDPFGSAARDLVARAEQAAPSVEDRLTAAQTLARLQANHPLEYAAAELLNEGYEWPEIPVRLAVRGFVQPSGEPYASQTLKNRVVKLPLINTVNELRDDGYQWSEIPSALAGRGFTQPSGELHDVKTLKGLVKPGARTADDEQ